MEAECLHKIDFFFVIQTRVHINGNLAADIAQ